MHGGTFWPKLLVSMSRVGGECNSVTDTAGAEVCCK